jgi:hypothetical protein
MQNHTTGCAKSINQRRIWGMAMKYWLIAGAVLAMTWAVPAKAQSVPVFGVTTCGTPPTTITNGKQAYLTVLVGSGALCSTGGGAGGATVVTGNVSNASSGVASTSTNVPVVGYNYVWNGTTWDQATGVVVGPTTLANSLSMVQNSQYPVNSVTTTPTPITGRGTGSTGAVVGTLAAASTATTYICGFDVSAIGGTAAVGPVVVAGLVGGSFTYQMSSAATAVLLTRSFSPCIPASAVNTTITVTTTADGTASAVDVNVSGYQL